MLTAATNGGKAISHPNSGMCHLGQASETGELRPVRSTQPGPEAAKTFCWDLPFNALRYPECLNASFKVRLAAPASISGGTRLDYLELSYCLPGFSPAALQFWLSSLRRSPT